MSISRMQGTPFHIERLGDGHRRYRTKCRYFGITDQYCSKTGFICSSPSHCSMYDEMSAEEVKAAAKQRRASGIKQKNKTPKKKQDFWFMKDDDSSKKAKPPVTPTVTTVIAPKTDPQKKTISIAAKPQEKKTKEISLDSKPNKEQFIIGGKKTNHKKKASPQPKEIPPYKVGDTIHIENNGFAKVISVEKNKIYARIAATGALKVYFFPQHKGKIRLVGSKQDAE